MNPEAKWAVFLRSSEKPQRFITYGRITSPQVVWIQEQLGWGSWQVLAGTSHKAETGAHIPRPTLRWVLSPGSLTCVSVPRPLPPPGPLLQVLGLAVAFV